MEFPTIFSSGFRLFRAAHKVIFPFSATGFSPRLTPFIQSSNPPDTWILQSCRAEPCLPLFLFLNGPTKSRQTDLKSAVTCSWPSSCLSLFCHYYFGFCPYELASGFCLYLSYVLIFRRPVILTKFPSLDVELFYFSRPSFPGPIFQTTYNLRFWNRSQ